MTKNQKQLNIGFQGIAGAYSEKAAIAYFSDQRFHLKAFPSFSNLFEGLTKDIIDYAVVPIENSLAGSIHENYDHILNNDVWISGEFKLTIEHSFIAAKNSRLHDITHVYSHPQALSQCSEFLKSLDVEICPYFDTAGSVEFIAKQKNKAFAAIAGAHAAEDYNLSVLKNSIQDNDNNMTRFFIIEKRKSSQEETNTTGSDRHDKTSLVFALRNLPGALHKALSIFAIRDIDLTKIESRPLRSTPWKYYFYLDIDGGIQDKRIKKAIEHLSEITSFQKVTGSYPSSKT